MKERITIDHSDYLEFKKLESKLNDLINDKIDFITYEDDKGSWSMNYTFAILKNNATSRLKEVIERQDNTILELKSVIIKTSEVEPIIIKEFIKRNKKWYQFWK